MLVAAAELVDWLRAYRKVFKVGEDGKERGSWRKVRCVCM